MDTICLHRHVNIILAMATTCLHRHVNIILATATTCLHRHVNRILAMATMCLLRHVNMILAMATTCLHRHVKIEYWLWPPCASLDMWILSWLWPPCASIYMLVWYWLLPPCASFDFFLLPLGAVSIEEVYWRVEKLKPKLPFFFSWKHCRLIPSAAGISIYSTLLLSWNQHYEPWSDSSLGSSLIWVHIVSNICYQST